MDSVRPCALNIHGDAFNASGNILYNPPVGPVFRPTSEFEDVHVSGIPEEAYFRQLDERTAKRRRLRRGLLGVACVLALTAVSLGIGWRLGRAGASAKPPRRVLPGEFERHEALLFAWPTAGERQQHLMSSSERQELAESLAAQRRLLARVLRAVDGRLHAVVLVEEDARPSAQQTLDQLRVGSTSLTYVTAPVSLLWVRDYGPLVAKNYRGGFDVLDTVYENDDYPSLDQIPADVARHLGLPLCKVPVYLEGGNLLSNGAGLAVATDKLWQHNQVNGITPRRLQQYMEEELGVRQLVYLESLADEPTGHADLFVTFTSVDTVIVGQFDPEDEPLNAQILDRNAAALRKVQTASGPLRVFRVPMPRRSGEKWRTYTNVVFVNGALLIPHYGDVPVEVEQRAYAVYRQQLPNWQLTPIDCTDIAHLNGALHCATMNLIAIPKGSRRAE